MAFVVSAAVVLTVAAAARSTWSPCGLSMLSSMTPLTERARGHRYWITALWYMAGAVAGGATVGAILALVSIVPAVAGTTATVAAVVVAVTAAITGAADLRLGPELPRHRRQVDENWFSGLRRWAYASGFGWQIGNGFATYTTTPALYAAAVGAVAVGSPSFALCLGIGFGTVRGLAVILGVGLTDLDAVRRMHARLDVWAEPSRILTGAVQVAVAVALAATAHVALAFVVVAAVALSAFSTGAAARHATSSPSQRTSTSRSTSEPPVSVRART